MLVHDLDMLRGGHEESEPLLRKARRLIVHTEAMKAFLCKRGFNGENIKVLQCFDYLVEHLPAPKPSFTGGNDIAFAGNLEKANFSNCFLETKYYLRSTFCSTVPHCQRTFLERT